MKIYKITVTLLAKHQLSSIRDYIATAYSSPDTARTVINELFNVIFSLKTMPCRYRVIDAVTSTKYKIRKVRCKNYYIYYCADENTLRIYVLSVIYVKANQDNALHVIVKSI